MARHDWSYKQIDEKRFLICCMDCGKNDSIVDSEGKAKAKVRDLRTFGINPESKVQKIFAPYPRRRKKTRV